MTEPARIWLKQPEAVFTANDQDASNGIVIEGPYIVELVGKGRAPRTEVDTIHDMRGKVITPGLINTHHHFYQTLTRCLPAALNKPLFPWLKTLYQVWQHLDEEMVFYATQLAALELMMSGATTVADHHYVFPKGLEHGIDVQAEALQALACRALLTRGSMSLGESSGGLPPDSVIQSEDTILADSERVIAKYHQRQDGATLQIALAPCSPFSVSEQLMKDTAVLVEKAGVLMHTHLAETEDENSFCLSHCGMRPLAYLESCGWLTERAWLAHGIHFTPAEIASLGRAQVGIAHCPSSNMLLASGICPAWDLTAAGAAVGLAVDGSASNDCSNMMQEVRQSLLQLRLRYGAEKITAQTVLGYATRGSASLMHRQDIGDIAVGKQADLAVWRLDEPRFSGAGDAIAALVQCGAHQVDAVYVSGQQQDYESLYQHYIAIAASHRAAAQRLQNLI